MIDGIRLKVCGLTTLVDAEFADRAGADYLGFILYPKSQRYLSLRQYVDMAPRLPEGRKRVAVLVEPTLDELATVAAAGFDRFQLHFRHELPASTLESWSAQVGRERLWLAPKLPPEIDVSAAMLAAASTLLLDTYHPGAFGGTGLTGDWGKFRSIAEAHPEHTCVLAGGLTPETVGPALAQSGARFVDVASGVELAPGIKDHAKLKQFVLAIHRQRLAAVSP